MAGRGAGPDFVESLARGLDVLQCFSADRPRMSLSEIAEITRLARPTARRLLLTLEELGFVRLGEGQFSLTPRVLSLGMAFVASLGLWEVGRPHLERLVAQTGESSSMSQLDGSDIVYVARVAVPKLITLRVEIGTRFPAAVHVAGQGPAGRPGPGRAGGVLAQPSRSGLPRFLPRDPQAFGEELCTIRARGWALADEELAPGIRSIAAPVRDGTGGVRAAMNVTVHAAETSVERLTGEYLPLLLRTAGDVSADWALWQSRPYSEVASGQDASSGGRSSG